MTQKKYDISKHEFNGKTGKIYIGIPRERFYIPRFVDNRDLILAENHQAERGSGYFQAEGHRVDHNRDRICLEFLKTNNEWLLMLDSDMTFPSDVGIRLATWNKPIVGGLYFHRGESHDPFLFKRDKMAVGNDLFGRERRQWLPMRDEVYEFLKEMQVPPRDGAVAIGEPGEVGLIEVDAVATGSMLIHRSVLETMEPPWFEYISGGQSEDLVFCDRAKFDYGIPIYCDMSTIAGHMVMQPMGYAQFMTMYEGRGVNLSLYTLPEIANWYAEYFDMEVESALPELQDGNAHMVSTYWNTKKPETDEEIREFYADEYTGRLYVNELIHWNASTVFDKFKKMLMPFRNVEALELGSGIGSMSIQLALQHCNVDSYEINDVVRGFAELRWEKLLEILGHHKGEILFAKDGWKDMPDESYDLVLAFDVMEHLAKSDAEEFVMNAGRLLRTGGSFMYHNNWHQQDLYPMHFNYEEEWDGWLKSAGLFAKSAIQAIKLGNTT